MAAAEEIGRGDEEDGKTKHKHSNAFPSFVLFLVFKYLIVVFKL
jgi:hypothetical protein